MFQLFYCFLSLATKEVVVLDFHRFPIGFNPPRGREIHNQLVQLLEQELGSFMVPADQRFDVTLDTLWTLNKTLVVAYADDYIRSSNPFLWPSIPQVNNFFLFIKTKLSTQLCPGMGRQENCQ